jgi:hypothetical protein
MRSDFLDWKTKLDGALMLGVYITAPLIVIGWIACTILFFSGQSFLPTLAAFFLASTCYNTFGNFASFFEIGSSVILDGAHRRVRLLPLNIANFVFSTATVSTALGKYYTNRLRGREPGERWIKTQRFRGGPGGVNGAGLTDSSGGSGRDSEADGISYGPASGEGGGNQNSMNLTFLNIAPEGSASGRGLNYVRAANGGTNGHSNGNGKSNGHANGHSNGNGISNGRSVYANGNGKARGLDLVRAGNGNGNGHAKVPSNGHANGNTNGNGHSNGDGHAVVAGNGKVNGNGHANGNGHELHYVSANGHSNGNGYANGNGHSNGNGVHRSAGDDAALVLKDLQKKDTPETES